MILDTSALVSILLREPGHEMLLHEINAERFGKGHHPAGLNFGDCMTYALAVATGLPVLCTGKDFPRTDVPCA